MTTQLLTEPQQRRQGGAWDYISASRLNLWLKCPLAFALRYVHGVKTPKSPALFLGSQVHSGLELWYRHRHLGMEILVPDVIAKIEESWDQAADEDGMAFASVAEETATKKKVGDLIEAYVAKVPADEPRPMAVEARMEAPLIDPDTGENLGIPLLGIVDLILPTDDGGPLICDFKTSARSSAPLEQSHEIQLGCYAYLLRQVQGQVEGGLEIRSLIKTKVPKIEFHWFEQRTDDHLRRLFSVIRAYLDDLDARRFVYRPDMGCSMCDFVDLGCRGWDGR